MKREPRIIVALDVDGFAKAKGFVDKLYPRVKIFKIGSQLFTAAGPAAVEYVRKKGAEVFLDLKFFDIPHTVANAVCQAVRLKVKMLTLHISGGKEMIEAAVRAAKKESRRLKIKRPLIIGITVLTSQKAEAGDVLALARKGINSGLDGVVCSVLEAALLKKKIKNNFIIVTPGIRPAKSAGNDQKRTATPQAAIEAGSDFLVVGRPVLEAKDPSEAVRELI